MQNPDLLLDSYNYDLPEELIAQKPADKRHDSRLLIYHEASGEITHTHFHQLPNFLNEQDCLVFNQSKVFPCRLKAEKFTGGKVEVFVLDLQKNNNAYQCLLKANGKKEIGLKLKCEDIEMEIAAKNDDGTFQIKFPENLNLLTFLEEHGHVPIPPYIRGGNDNSDDKEKYQTVYAKQMGSVAAPTAGLHFSDEILNKLPQQKAYLTLHVGMGTFKPVATEKITDHKMHSEKYFVDNENLKKLKENRRKIAVGTTSLRVLESLKSNYDEMGNLKETDIFLYPGIEVNSIVGLLTNFHLPKSSLIMLVSSLIGREKTLELYNEAIKNKYRFFSYGDAMLILRKSWS